MTTSWSRGVQVLTKLQFQMTECKHHVRGFLVVDGKKVLCAHLSFGSGDMPAFVAQKFRKSLHLNQTEFAEMVNCSMQRKEYIALLVRRGLIVNSET